MSSMQKILRWLFLFIALGFLLGVVIFYWVTQSGPRIPPCEAMRPYIQYHGTTYLAVSGSVTSSDLGSTITTIGDGADQAKSCMPSGTSVYSVRGYPSASRLAADFGGLRLFEAVSPTSTSTPSPSASATRR